jgi:hypothetical protein
MTVPDDVARTYRVSFLRYLDRREEVALHHAYELGRTAIGRGVSILALAQLHHDILLEALQDARPDQVPQVATAASEFFLEVLATSDMAQRAYLSGEAADPPPAQPGGTPPAG